MPETNLTRVMRGAEHMIGQISIENGYRSRGVVCIRGGDPTKFQGDKQDAFRKLCRGVGLFPGGETETDMVVGGRRRYKRQYKVFGLVQLTDDERQADRTLDEVLSDLQEDLKDALDPDIKIKNAVAALALPEVSCIDHHVTGIVGDDAMNFPFARFVAVVEFLYDRPIRMS